MVVVVMGLWWLL
jgi:hypothetical protein